MISISIAPGGNPVALADPDHWARSWRGCPNCVKLYCERCAPESRADCPTCGTGLMVPDHEGFVRLYFGGPRAWFDGLPPA
jgi:hypothetical protein